MMWKEPARGPEENHDDAAVRMVGVRAHN